MHFRFEGDEHIADFALYKAGGGAASAGIEDFDVAEDVFQEVVLFGFAFECVLRVAKRPEIGVAAITAGFRVGEDDFHAVFDEVIPVFDLFRVALAHEEGSGGVVRRAVMRQAFAPVFRQQFSFLREDINIGHLVEGDDIGFQPLQDGVRLL